jgi:hypothetical protein
VRFALRRGASAPDGSAPGPLATFAELVDGHLLWVAVAAQPGDAGELGLRDVASGEAVAVPTTPVTDRPGHLGACLDLAGLDGAEGRRDVVLSRPGHEPVALTTGPRGAGAVRPGLDGCTRHAVVRSPEGTLRVRSTLLPDAAGLAAVRVVPEGVELTLLDAGPELVVLDDDEVTPLASWPVDEHGVVLLTPGSLDGLGEHAALAGPALTGRDGAWRPVRRRDNDLADPRSGAPLPQLEPAADDGPRLRLHWSRDALLQVRVLDPAEETG